jgi:hypothetical protein
LHLLYPTTDCDRAPTGGIVAVKLAIGPPRYRVQFLTSGDYGVQ